MNNKPEQRICASNDSSHEDGDFLDNLRVERLRELIRTGEYVLDPIAVAAAIIRRGGLAI